MKTACTLILTAVILFIFNTTTSAEMQKMTAEQYRQYELYGSASADYANARKNDKDDLHWGFGDWRTRAINKALNKKGFANLYEPKNLYEWLDDTRQTFKSAEIHLTSKEELNYLAICQKMREAGIIFEVLDVFAREAPEVSRAAYPGPFWGTGGKEEYYMVQILWAKAWDNYIKTGEEYTSVLSKTNQESQARVRIALFNIKGKTYEVERHQLALQATGKLPLSGSMLFQEYIYYSSHFIKIKQPEVDAWKEFFRSLTDRDRMAEAKRAPTTREGPIIRGYLKLVMDPGAPLGMVGNQTLPTQDEFIFLWRQSEHCWQNLINPSPEMVKNLPRFTYWQRNSVTGEPSLILKVAVPDTQSRFDRDTVKWAVTHLHPTISFLKGLCPAWRKDLADFEKTLPTTGVSADLIKDWHNEGAVTPRNLTAAEKDWLSAMSQKENELNAQYFAKQRLAWRRISAEEYSVLKAEQDEWVKTHSDKAFDAKLQLCGIFSRIIVPCNIVDTNGMPIEAVKRCSLEQMESGIILASNTVSSVEATPKYLKYAGVRNDEQGKRVFGRVVNIFGRDLALNFEKDTIVVRTKEGVIIYVIKEGKKVVTAFESVKVGDYVSIVLDKNANTAQPLEGLANAD